MTIHYVHRAADLPGTGSTEQLKETIRKARQANQEGKRMYEDAVKEIDRLKSELARGVGEPGLGKKLDSASAKPVKTDAPVKTVKTDAAVKTVKTEAPAKPVKTDAPAKPDPVKAQIKSLMDQVEKLQLNKKSSDELNSRLSVKKEQLEKRVRELERAVRPADDPKSKRLAEDAQQKLAVYKGLIENTCSVLKVAIRAGCEDGLAASLRDTAETLEMSVNYL